MGLIWPVQIPGSCLRKALFLVVARPQAQAIAAEPIVAVEQLVSARMEVSGQTVVPAAVAIARRTMAEQRPCLRGYRGEGQSQ